MTQSKSSWFWKLKLAIFLAVGGAITSAENCSLAQITRDTTLGSESSVVTPLNSQFYQIDGGARREANLFHSFQVFNIGDRQVVEFTNPAGIDNIVSRVTGGSRSEILGKLSVAGNANLFLLNPNGIIFGPNASLDVKSSFIGTTANAIQFGNQGFFSASAPNELGLLTVNPSALLFNQIAAGEISSNSREPAGQRLDPSTPSGFRDLFGLRVPDGRSLLLVGGNVSLDGGVPSGVPGLGGGLNALGGRVELGGLAEAGMVGLNGDNNNLSLSFPVGVRLSDLSLNNGAVVTAGEGGSIVFNAQNIDVSGRSLISAGIARNPGSTGSQAGDITLNATEAITLGQSSTIENKVNPNAIGNSGNINITTGLLSLTNGAQINASTNTERQGNAGSVNINANDAVSLDGIDSSNGNRRSGIFGRVGVGAVGNGGKINITAESLDVTDGAQISATTGGQGNAGSVTVNAHGTVSLDGDESRIASRVEDQAVGDGGNIDITAGSVKLTDGARLAGSMSGVGNAASIKITASDTVSFDGQSNDGQRSGASSSVAVTTDEAIRAVRVAGVGNGGDIEITTGSLFVKNGAEVNSSTFGDGDAGSVTITASNAVSIDGTGIRDGRTIFSRVSSNVEPQAVEGNAGQVNIKADSLSVINGGVVNVSNSSSRGSGDAGELKVEADQLLLDEGRLTARVTTSGNGGNINLQVRDLILMRQGSLISAEARRNGNGGNVRIGNASNAPVIVTSPAENSDIIAQANQGQGGEIDIFTQGIFGIEERNPTTPQTNDINASSEVGIDGTVEINRLDIDPSQRLVALPTELVDVSRLIAQGCSTGGGNVARSSKFVATGRGGLPPTPTEAVRSDAALADLGTPVQDQENRAGATSTNPTNSQPTPLVEAQGWVIGPQGEVVLIAQAPTVTPHTPWLTPITCNGS